MSAFQEAAKVLNGVVDGSVSYFIVSLPCSSVNRSHQIALDQTTLDAAKSSIVYSVTKGVSTAGRAVRYFIFTAD
jgi:hypothetical protein